MKQARYLALGLCIMIFVLVTVVQYYAFNEKFYMSEYEKYDIYSSTDLDEEAIVVATQAIVEYLEGTRDTLEVEYNGMMIFNNKEMAHMKDVKAIFKFMNMMKMLAGILGILIMVMSKKLSTLMMGTIYATGASLLLFGGVGVLMLTDFNAAFVKFHEMFFSNDLWLLDPRTDRLIQLLPEGFFLDMTTMIVLSHLAIVITMMFLVVYNYRKISARSSK
jgi:integral membrane protein (TIGR01906 family)